MLVRTDKMNVYGEILKPPQLRFNYSSVYAVSSNPRQGLKQFGPYDSQLFNKASIECGVIYPSALQNVKRLLVDGLVNGEGSYIGFKKFFGIPLSFRDERAIGVENVEEIRRASSSLATSSPRSASATFEIGSRT